MAEDPRELPGLPIHSGMRSKLFIAAVILLWLVACVPRTTEATGRVFHRQEDHFFDVLSYNVALLPEPVSYTLPTVRAAKMAPHLAGFDALVLQEAFIDGARERLVRDLAEAYPYRGDLVGRDGAGGSPLMQDGGVIILSRWPIVRQATMTFGATCSGTDCLGDKGVAYAAIQKGERTYHLFGTHLQSSFGRGVPDVRKAQFELFAGFIAEQQIPVDEPVLLAGDFNVDGYSPELAPMLETLDAWWPPVLGAVKTTWDPEGNRWAEGRGVWLDYVLLANGYGAPAAAWNRALPVRDGDLDLSDHYAVWGRVAMAPFTSISSTRH